MVVKEEAMSINHLPLDILHIILLKLPVKSLLWFKTVDKSWNAIISDHDFAKKHLLQSKNATNQNNLLWRPVSMDRDKRYRLVNFENDKFQVEAMVRHPYAYLSKVLCSSNDGLLVLSTFTSTCYMLWNTSSNYQIMVICPYTFICNTTAFGFCRGPTLDDYKIVARSWGYYAVFTCKNEVWTEKKEFPYDNIRYKCGREVVYIDGFSFWIMSDRVTGTLEILYFDPRDDMFKMLQKPRKIEGFGDYFSLTSLKGCLYLYENDDFKTLRRLQIWMVRDRNDVDSNSWTELICDF